MVLHVAMSHLGASKCLCCTGESAAFTSHTSWFLGSENRYAGNSLGHSDIPHIFKSHQLKSNLGIHQLSKSSFTPTLVGPWLPNEQNVRLAFRHQHSHPRELLKTVAMLRGGLGYGDLRSSPWFLTQKIIFYIDRWLMDVSTTASYNTSLWTLVRKTISCNHFWRDFASVVESCSILDVEVELGIDPLHTCLLGSWDLGMPGCLNWPKAPTMYACQEGW